MFGNEARLARRTQALLAITWAHAGALLGKRVAGRWTPTDAARHTQRWSSQLCESLGLRVQVTGQPLNSPCLYVPNHRSYSDVIVVGSALPCTFLAKSQVASWPLLGQAAAAGGTLFVRREARASRRAAREAVARTLLAGVSVVVFPEGTSTDHPSVLPFKPGVFEVATALGVPVVPVAIHYADPEMAWVGDDTFAGHFARVFRTKSHTVQLHFGPPLAESDSQRLRQMAWSWCNDRVASLCAGHTKQEA